MSCRILMSMVLTSLIAGAAFSPAASANPDTQTVCVPFSLYHGMNHQECTVYFYGSDGSVLFTNVYYIDENGMWYLR